MLVVEKRTEKSRVSAAAQHEAEIQPAGADGEALDAGERLAQALTRVLRGGYEGPTLTFGTGAGTA